MKQTPQAPIQRAMPPEPTLRRLPWYLAYVAQLKSKGIEYVSSTQIARALNVDASQIVKDLSLLSIKGKTRIGYSVDHLCSELEDFLGFKKCHPAVIVGVGSLGRALISDSGLQRFGLNIVAGFDVNPEVISDTTLPIPIHSLEELRDVCLAHNAEIGIVTVPAEYAQATADSLVDAGIKALWNFTPFRILTPEGVVIQNISIYAHLALMYNRLEAMKGGVE